jgi:hypothetical protein
MKFQSASFLRFRQVSLLAHHGVQVVRQGIPIQSALSQVQRPDSHIL